jgi:predicted hydrocarbon binding protein
MPGDLVYVVHSEADVARTLSTGLQESGYTVVPMTTETQADAALDGQQFVLPDAILTPLGDLESGDSILIRLFQANPLMEQIPLVVVASSGADERRRALRMGLLSVIFPPYDAEEVVLTTRLAIEKHRSEQMLFGAMSQLSVPDLLQTAEVGRRSGTVSFQHEGRKGVIWLRDGLLIAAGIDGASEGLGAVYDMVHWDTGTFEAQFGPVEVEESFRVLPSEVVLEAMRRLDEAQIAATSPPPSPDTRRDATDLEVASILLNLVTSYAANHVSGEVLTERVESERRDLVAECPDVGTYRVLPTGAVVSGPDDPTNGPAVLATVAVWIAGFVDRMDQAMAWRFGHRRLAQLVEPWRDHLRRQNLLRTLGIEDTEPAEQEVDETRTGRATLIPLGCYVVDRRQNVSAYVPYGPTGATVDHSVIVGRPLHDVLPPELSSAVHRLTTEVESDNSELWATGEADVSSGHQALSVQLAWVMLPTGRTCLTLHRRWPADRALDAGLERDVVHGTIHDDRGTRLLAVNEDFIASFEGLFSKTLGHRHQELLQRFGKQWGLRHAVRLERVVQREFRATLREVETQVALELLASSMGVLGLGRFDAELRYRDRGVIAIVHHDSPFPAALPNSRPPVCGLLSGFYAALMSYLSGRQLAARELSCSTQPSSPCRFVVATEDRLTRLLVATPDSPDHALLTEIATGRAE